MAKNLVEARIEEFLRQSPQASQEEIAEFRKTVEQYCLGEISPDEFKSRRLILGTYGIRGVTDIQMVRVKIPEGRLNPEQLERLADIADKYSKGIGHLTTRQDMQLYWVPVKETPLVLASISAVGLTTREACGNSVRNVTACEFAGVSPTEAFDVTKHAEAVTSHFLRNPVSQKLPRKFKIAFEGCPVDHARTAINDIGAVAAIQEQDGRRVLGFRLYLGGGLGPPPMQAVILEPFTPTTELLRTCEAVVRVHDRLGDRKNKATARLKFVVKRLGAEAVRQEVFTERAKLPQYPYSQMSATETDERPPATENIESVSPVNGVFQRWMFTNAMGQKQSGYSAVTIRLPLGDMSSSQMRALSQIASKYCAGRLRTTIAQNIVLRWVRSEHLAALYGDLAAVDLAEAEAERLYDVTSCPGAETCQLGITASRGLTRALEQRFKEAGVSGEDIDRVRIKVSGCPNSCGHHHIADIGFFGGAKKVDGHVTPHFQLLLGGNTQEGKAEFGKSVIKLPARRVPEAVVRMFELYRKDRTSKETFRDFATRMGIEYWKKALDEFMMLPPYEQAPEAYRDWGSEQDFTLAGMGPGECAA